MLVHQGKSDFTIVHGRDCHPSEKAAAYLFQSCVKEITGVELPVMSDSMAFIHNSELSRKKVLIGRTGKTNCWSGENYFVNREYLGDDGFTIKQLEDCLFITGGEKRGTLYGVYTFFEKYFGCRWFAKDVVKIPKTDNMAIPENLDYTYKPALSYRDIHWACAWDPEWSAAQKVNGNVRRLIPEERGGGISYAGQFVHSFEALVPPSEYFESHPEYYSEIGGERRHKWAQLCLSNPDVLKIATEKVREYFRKDPEATICSVSQNDSGEDGGYCQCKKCNEIFEKEGSQAGAVILFVNKIADAIKEEFPEKFIDTLAYRYTRKPPKYAKPKDNVIVRLCSIECCFSHPIEECDNTEVESMKGENFLSDLINWSKISKNLYIWDYTTNYKYFLTPFPNFQVLAKNIQTFIKYNSKGIFEQGNQQDDMGGEFGELRSYILAKLLWDPSADVNLHMNEFLENYYGNGWKNIREYIDIITEKAVANHFGIYSEPEKIIDLSAEEIKTCDILWDKAENEADNEIILNRIKRSRLQLDFYKLITERGEFENASPEQLFEARKHFYKNIELLGTKYLREGGPWLKRGYDYNKPISSWAW